MSNFENLKDSLNLLTRKNPKLVQNILLLQQSHEQEKFSFENTQKGELNLFFNKKHHPFFLHDPHGAASEASNWCKSLDPNRDVLYQFGVGLGYTFIFLKKWLEADSSRFLVYLEPHLGVLFHLFQTEIGKKIADHPQVHLYYFKKRDDLDHLIEYLVAFYSMMNPAYSPLNSYEKAYPNLSKYLQKKLPEKQEMLNTRLIESTTSSPATFMNYLMKSPYLNGHYNASKFSRLFAGIPCIICGAGPSLKKNVELLKTLNQKALILAGSSAVPALLNAGVEPHFANFFDPYPRVHERFLNTTLFELPTFHCARTYRETSRWIHGPALYTKGSDDTPFVDWIENELGFDGALVREYISVTAYNTSIALMMGCNPIIYVGVDLAYTGNKTYMEGINKDIDYKQNAEVEDEYSRYNQEVLARDIYGEPILTRFAWEVESRFISEILAPHQDTRTIINATEGGIGFSGVTNSPLEEVKKEYLGRNYPLEEWVHAKITPHQVIDPKIKSKCLARFREVKQSFSRLEKYYRSVLKETAALQKENTKDPELQINEDYIQKAEGFISEEIGYQYYMVHHHQIVNIDELKTHNIFAGLSLEAPKTLLNEIILTRITRRFSRYLEYLKSYKMILNQFFDEIKQEPWD